MLDVSLLRIMKYKKDFAELYGHLQDHVVDGKTKTMLAAYSRYFNQFSEHSKIDWSVFIPRFFEWNSAFTDEQKDVYKQIIRTAVPDVDQCTRDGIVSDINDVRLGTELINLADKFENGDLPDIALHVQQAVDKHKLTAGIKSVGFIDVPIDELLDEELDSHGVKWRLPSLNRCMRGLRPGDFGIIAARPDKGKTSFIADNVVHFAHQIPDDRNIVWLNNEGLGKRIIPRLYQSALSMNTTELAAAAAQGTAIPAYREAVGGRCDKIRIVDIHNMHIGQVEAALEENNAGIAIYDMLDNVRGFGGEARTDLMLEEMYKWGRNISVKHELIGLATSQISNEGSGEPFPTLGMLKDSKTGKQGACDFQLMIGHSDAIDLAPYRWLSLPKNKLRLPTGAADPRAQVEFDGARSRFKDIPLEEEL